MENMHNIIHGLPLPIITTAVALPILSRGNRAERRKKGTACFGIASLEVIKAQESSINYILTVSHYGPAEILEGISLVVKSSVVYCGRYPIILQ